LVRFRIHLGGFTDAGLRKHFFNVAAAGFKNPFFNQFALPLRQTESKIGSKLPPPEDALHVVAAKTQ
jgi:hypothetical protein